MTACPGCPATYSGQSAQHCLGCHVTFGSTEAGDRHRTGNHGVRVGPDRRRCLIGRELVEAGLELNARGQWVRARELGTAALEGVKTDGGDSSTRRRPRRRRVAAHQAPSGISTGAAA